MKVLLVEDDDSLRAGYLTLLDKSGLAVDLFAAGSVDDAVRTADEVHPDMIFLDLHLGTGQNDGLKVFDHVRGRPYGSNTYIVAVTAFSTSDVKSMLERRGFNKVLFKADYHYDDDQIVRIIRERMSSQHLERPVSSPAGPAPLSDREKLGQAIHDLSTLIEVKGAVCLTGEDKTRLKQLVQTLDASYPDNPALDVAEPKSTAPSLLVVEDDPAQQDALAKVLEGVGYHVTVSNGISDARSRLDRQSFDAYIVDVFLGPGEKGTDISSLLSAEQARKVVYMTAHPGEFRQSGVSIYDKSSNQPYKLLELVHQMAPLPPKGLVNERETAARGKQLLEEVQRILRRDHGASSADSEVTDKCRAYADWVLNDPSVGANKYIIASDYLGRALKLMEGIPFMVDSRQSCVESHSRVYARWLYGSGRYLSWFGLRIIWGGITGYGYSMKKIALTFGCIVAICAVLIAMNPETFRFVTNNKELATMTEGERWWSSAFIAAAHGLLISTEVASPVSVGAQLLTLLQTLSSVLLLGLLVGAITFRIKQGT